MSEESGAVGWPGPPRRGSDGGALGWPGNLTADGGAPVPEPGDERPAR